jgi:hypothetical protein
MIIIVIIFALSYPIDSWQNETLEEVQVRGVHFTRFPSIRPYELPEDTVFVQKTSEGTVDGSIPALWLSNISLYYRYDTVNALRFKPRLYADWADFSFTFQPVVKFGRDSLPPSRVFAGLFAGDYERAAIEYKRPFFKIFLGRERFSIGPSPRYNLILSGYGAPMDWFHYALRSKVFQLTYYLSQLDDMTCKPYEFVGDTFSQRIHARRFLVIKRLDVSPVDWLNFSFSEAATFGGENYALTPYQFNPVVLLHTYQHNWDKSADIFFHFDAKVYARKSAFYAALLVDDFQLQPDPNGEPNHFGFTAGFESCDLGIERSFFIFEYTRLSRWVYCIFAPYERYEYRNTAIGYPYGPDGDELYGKYAYHLRPGKIDVSAALSYRRKGENEINTIWPIPDPDRVLGTFFPENNFLSGVVEKSLDLSAGLRFFYKRLIAIDLAAGASHATNYRHHAGESKLTPTVKAQFDFLNLFHN